MEQQAEPKKAAPKPLNQMPTGKVKLGEWLHGRVPHGAVEEEYRFHPTRKWRFDWFLPAYNIAVEYEGFMQMGSNAAHSAVTGIMRDVEKYNESQAMGIRVFRAHAENVRTGAFFELMERVLTQEYNVKGGAVLPRPPHHDPQAGVVGLSLTRYIQFSSFVSRWPDFRFRVGRWDASGVGFSVSCSTVSGANTN